MSLLQTLGLKLLGSDALAAIKAEVVTLAERTFRKTEDNKSFVDRTSTHDRELFLSDEIANPGRLRQIQAALLVQLVGDKQRAYEVIKASDEAEASGEGFMKKKAAVLKVVKEFGLSKSVNQLVIELAVQLSKD
jgi:hypothetical protein